MNADLSIGGTLFPGTKSVTYTAGTDGTHIIIGSITDYESPGEIAVYEFTGTLLESFSVGVIPGSILSYTRD